MVTVARRVRNASLIENQRPRAPIREREACLAQRAGRTGSNVVDQLDQTNPIG